MKKSLTKKTEPVNPADILQAVPLSQIAFRPDHNNRDRSDFADADFDSLVASIAKVGVLQPVLLRPIKCGYELVAGERRARAKIKLAIANGGLDENTIPATIREMSDAEASEFMLVENLQRKALSPLAEARGFRDYVNKGGDGATERLAEKISMSPAHIRRHMAILDLPGEILESWDKDVIAFGHLEQMIRVPADNAIDLFNWMIDQAKSWRGQTPTVKELAQRINNQAPGIKEARFNVKQAGCATCHRNSDQQKSLFEVADLEKMQCMNPSCFKAHQLAHMQKVWLTTKTGKEAHTKTCLFSDSLKYDQYNAFGYGDKSPEACIKCDKFVSLIRLDGHATHERVCIGDEACFKNARAGTVPAKQAKAEIAKAAAEKANARATKHGTEFREVLFAEKIPELIKKTSAQSGLALKLALTAMVHMNSGLKEWFSKEMTGEEICGYNRPLPTEVMNWCDRLDDATVKQYLKDAAAIVALQDDFGHDGRFGFATRIGLDLQRDFVITEEYLKKKTIAEIHEIGEQHKVFADENAKHYLHNVLHKAEKGVGVLKKSELIKLFTQSGANLAGKVPAEIMDIAA
ncbi:MAG: ParB/RepB/Spo0J family partition protein [Desulfobacterales bacterium]|nr:ParB/RepB/Spo0J family partition protein [Desulfobacterales bacterium]